MGGLVSLGCDPVTPPAPSSHLSAILMVVAAMSIVAFQDAAVKYLAQHMPAAQVTWARYFFHLAINMGTDPGIESGKMFLDPTQQVLEILQVGNFHVLLVAELLDHLRHAVATHLPGIDRLQCATP